MNVISTTLDYKGIPVKIDGTRIFLRSFGSTIYNNSMHWSWTEVKKKDLNPELREMLEDKNLI